jgi:hypothetical protein
LISEQELAGERGKRPTDLGGKSTGRKRRDRQAHLGCSRWQETNNDGVGLGRQLLDLGEIQKQQRKAKLGLKGGVDEETGMRKRDSSFL